jgi:dolichol-phosphate mannosyltransferase
MLLIIGAFQLFFLFVLGQYVARIYDEARGRPLYVVATTTGFDDSKPEGAPAREPMAETGA